MLLQDLLNLSQLDAEGLAIYVRAMVQADWSAPSNLLEVEGGNLLVHHYSRVHEAVEALLALARLDRSAMRQPGP